MDFLLSVLPVSVQHRIGQGFAKRDLYVAFVSGNTLRNLDESHQPVHERRDRIDFAWHRQTHAKCRTYADGRSDQRLKVVLEIHLIRPPGVYLHCHAASYPFSLRLAYLRAGGEHASEIPEEE